jgi:splicing factor 3A subunit 2
MAIADLTKLRPHLFHALTHFTSHFDMDYQNRAGSRFGGGGVASKEETAQDRCLRIARLAAETVDFSKDPYWKENHYGGIDCRLCLTSQTNKLSYQAHTLGRKHQTNLARRGIAEQNSRINDLNTALLTNLYRPAVEVKKNFFKIGRPGFKVTKIRDTAGLRDQRGVLIQIQLPQISRDIKPRYRFMSTWEQKVQAQDKRFQYFVVAAEPYESVAFKLQSLQVDQREGKFWTHWDCDTKQYSLQFMFADCTPGFQ